MSSLGDTILALSTNVPLNTGTSWVSQSYMLGSYNSLTVMIKTDQDGTFNIEWSGDNGANFDAMDTAAITAGTSERISISSQQKTVRLSFNNTSLANQTYLRIYTYGTTTTNSVQATVTGLGGVIGSGTVQVSNLPMTSGNEMISTDFVPVKEYNFCNTYPASFAANSDPNIFNYSDLYSTSTDASATITNATGTGMVALYSNNASTQTAITGGSVTIKPGTAFDCRFSGAFSNTTASGTGTMRLMGLGRLSPTGVTGILDYAAFGYNKESDDSYSNFGIFINRRSAGTSTFYPMASWNGTATRPTWIWNDLNEFRIVRLNSASEYLYFYIMHPSNSSYILVHTEKLLQPSYLFSSSITNSFGLLYYMDNIGANGGALADNPSMVFRNFAIYSQVSRPMISNAVYGESFSGSYVSGDLQVVAYGLGGASASLPSNWYLSSITVCNTLGIDPLIVNIYNKSTTSGGSEVDVNTNMYFVKKTTGATFSSGLLCASFAVAPNSTYTYVFEPGEALIRNYAKLAIVIRSNSSTDYNIGTKLALF